MDKFTAIYEESWRTDQMRHTTTFMRRIQQQDGETVLDMIEREKIADNVIFLFVGWPFIVGEEVGK